MPSNGHEEVRRRTRVIRIFPHEAGLIRLLTSLAIEPTFLPEEHPMRRAA